MRTTFLVGRVTPKGSEMVVVEGRDDPLRSPVHGPSRPLVRP